tara:strand:+ start:48 stop:326 length:279 start_codon:yes stop_codon:yes gene_type:complete
MKAKYGILEYVHPISNRTSYKSVKLEDVGSDWFDCLTDDEQSYVQQMKKYSHLNYDEVIEQYDKDILPALIKRERKKGWECDEQGNIIGIIK